MVGFRYHAVSVCLSVRTILTCLLLLSLFYNAFGILPEVFFDPWRPAPHQDALLLESGSVERKAPNLTEIWNTLDIYSTPLYKKSHLLGTAVSGFSGYPLSSQPDIRTLNLYMEFDISGTHSGGLSFYSCEVVRCIRIHKITSCSHFENYSRALHNCRNVRGF